jgi:capsular polysaccharide biosynthesis protein
MEVSFIDIVKVILKRWWIILITIVIGGASAFMITNMEKPQYVSEASMYAEVKKAGNDYSFSDLNFVHALIPTFYDIMNEDDVYDELSELLAENDINISREGLKAKFTFVNKADTTSQSLIFKIRCTDGLKIEGKDGEKDQYFSAELLSAFLNIAIQKVPEIISSVEIHISAAPHYVSTIRPNVTFNGILGAFIGLVAGLLIVFVINSLDTRIDSAQELSKKFDIPVVGVIPTEIITTKEDETNAN